MQVENPSLLYIVGTWESPEHHERFLPSVENLGLFDLLGEDVLVGAGLGETVEGKGIRMWHCEFWFLPCFFLLIFWVVGLGD